MILPLFTGVLQLAQIWLTSKAREKQGLSEAKVKRMLSAADSEQSWTAFMAQASHEGWKDEAWTICFILIILACFVPSMQPYVERGFIVLGNTPDWFRWAMLASISASFGLRGFSKFLGQPARALGRQR